MALYDDVFYPQSLYESLFFSIKSVLIYPTLKELEAENKQLYERWMHLSQNKYNVTINEKNRWQEIYEKNAPYYPEFSRIIAITFGDVSVDGNGKPIRNLKRIANNDEVIVISAFMNELYRLSSEAMKSTPQYFPALCGYNIISYDIPLLIKRFLIHHKSLENSKLPLILKRSLSIKPWESGLIDVINVWKFNGYDAMTLMLIADYLGLKYSVELLTLPELSKYYWGNINDEPEKTLEFISLQSATQANLVIQVMNTLRQL